MVGGYRRQEDLLPHETFVLEGNTGWKLVGGRLRDFTLSAWQDHHVGCLQSFSDPEKEATKREILVPSLVKCLDQG